jgi:hypothetical protein
VIICLVLCIIGGLILFRSGGRQISTLHRMDEFFREGISGYIQRTRGHLLRPAWEMIKDYPLTGIGVGSFIIEVANYHPAVYRRKGTAESAENHFLQMAAEMGILGLALGLWLFWEIFRFILRGWRRLSPGDPRRFLYLGSAAGCLACFINFQFHTYIGSYEIKYLFWLMTGFVFFTGVREPEKGRKTASGRNFRLSAAVLILTFFSIQVWNSTHSLSLKSRTESLGLEQNFGLYPQETTKDGLNFQWTREYGGLALKVNGPMLHLPLLASHPGIESNPVKVKIYIIQELFSSKTLLGEKVISDNTWQSFTFPVEEFMGKEVILLVKTNRTWNPYKVKGDPDPRDLGVAMGTICFREF